MGLVAFYFKKFEVHPVIFCIEKRKNIITISILNGWGSLHPTYRLCYENKICRLRKILSVFKIPVTSYLIINIIRNIFD